jgi:tetratricopeptide (TPR) repeat protein
MREAEGQGPVTGTGGSSRNEAHIASAATVVQIGQVAGGVTMAAPEPVVLVPREVPAPPGTFVDRDDVLAWISGQVADRSQPPRVAVLAGLAGIGKRSAARRWAHLSRDRFPGGDLHVDCAEYGAGAGEGKAGVSGMVSACLRALGYDDRFMPAALPDRVRLFRTRTSAAPVLVVVENATEPGQVRQLIPNSPGSLVLVTSASDMGELHLLGAEIREMPGLDADSSTQLLAKVCGADRVADESASAVDLVRWCAGLPIALVVAAARLAATRSLQMAELAGELSDEARRLSALELGGKAMVSAVFTTSYGWLPDEARGLYRLLGLLPCVDVSPQTVAAATGVGAPEARRLLDLLVSAHLAEYRGNGRYGQHELVRLHARDRALQEEPAERRDALLHAVVRYFVIRAAFADRAAMGKRERVADHDVLLAGQDDPFAGPEAARQALAWLDSERANFIPVIEAAAAAGWNTQAWQLAEALTGYYYNRRHLVDWVTVSDVGARAARDCGEVRAEARLRISVSRAYTDQGDLGLARGELEAGTVLAQRSGDLVLEASAWEFWGRYFDAADPDPARALEAYNRAHDLNAGAQEWRGVALVLYFTGCTLESAGEHARALEELRHALDFLRWLGDNRMAGRALIAIGAAQAGLHKVQEAAESLQVALGLLTGLHYEAQAREALARVYEESGDHAAARQHLLAALDVYTRAGHPRAEEIARRLNSAQELSRSPRCQRGRERGCPRVHGDRPVCRLPRAQAGVQGRDAELAGGVRDGQTDALPVPEPGCVPVSHADGCDEAPGILPESLADPRAGLCRTGWRAADDDRRVGGQAAVRLVLFHAQVPFGSRVGQSGIADGGGETPQADLVALADGVDDEGRGAGSLGFGVLGGRESRVGIGDIQR